MTTYYGQQWDGKQSLSPAWWRDERKADRHAALFATVEFLRERQQHRSGNNLHALRMYSSREAHVVTGDNAPGVYMRGHDRLALNVARSIVDTVHSKMVQNKPKPTFLTSGGDFSAQRKAKLTDKLAAGMFYHSKYYEQRQRQMKDALIFGTGAMKITPGRDGKPRLERFFVDEMDVDEVEAADGCPRSYFHRRAADRTVVEETWAKHKDKIADAGMPGAMTYGTNSIADQVMLIEAWHMPSYPGAGDGWHTIACNTCTLVDEPWEHDYPPIVFMRWIEQPVGFWGMGICEQVSNIQFELNTLLRRAQEQMRMAGPKVFLERGSMINPEHIDNDDWSIIEYSGTAPTMAVFQSVHPEMFAQIDRLYQRAFDEVGVSQMAAQARKPVGLSSGKALMELNDIQSERLMAFGQEDERCCLEATDMMLDVARATHMQPAGDEKKGRPFTVSYPTKSYGRRFLETISWGDIDLERDEYVMQMFPTSQLPSTPAGKLEFISELVGQGMLDKEAAIALYDLPDTDEYVSEVTAARDDIRMSIELMLDDGKPQMPDAFTNFDLATKLMTSAIKRAAVQKYPDARVELVRRYVEQVQLLKKQMLAPPPPPPGAPPPTAGPGMPPPPPGAPMPGGAPGPAMPPGPPMPPPENQ